MGLVDRLRSSAVTLRAAAPLLPNLPRFLPGARTSAARLLTERARLSPNGSAIQYLDERWTWSEVDARTNQWANYFASRGVGRGDVVAIVMDNRPDYLCALTGLNRIGAVTACVNTHASGKPLIHAISIARPKLLLVGSEHASAIESVRGDLPPQVTDFHVLDDGEGPSHPSSVNERVKSSKATPPPGADQSLRDEPMAFLYTSGTTGLPKAATVTNMRFVAVGFGFGHMLHEATPEDVIYVALPLYHGTGQWGGWGAALTTGACIALRRKFSASAFWDDVNRFGATRFMYIGELCRYLLNQPPHPLERSHRVQIACGNGLRRDVWEPFQRRFGIPVVREFYGATEGNAPMANLENRTGMIGRLGLGQVLIACDPSTGEPIRDERGRCKKLDEPGSTGLLLGRISRLSRFDGYVDARATEKKILRDVFKKGDAYFDSGDLLTLHEDKWVSFADRVGDTFRWKGENVSTNEVAEVLNAAPGVIESNVFGVVVPGYEGRAGMAAIRTTNGFDLESFANHVHARLPGYQRPYFLRIESTIRTTSTLKHQKTDYRAEGFDPRRIHDPVYFLDGQRYVPIDVPLYEQIQSGKAPLR